MRYWWVNQNQTFRQEVDGGYLWSPQYKSDGSINPFYEYMREVAPGDLVFSFADTRIKAIGIARSSAYGCPKPIEFGSAGSNWGPRGWRVDVQFHQLLTQIRPADHIELLRPHLPPKYSPLQVRTGRGNQGVYLTTLPPMLAELLISLIGVEAKTLLMGQVEDSGGDTPNDVAVGLAEWEEHIAAELTCDPSITETEKEAVILARRGQGRFKQNVLRIEDHCRITGVDRIEHLRASHIKPWRECRDAEERLAGTNGLLLTPTMDHLFDRGFISFERSGELLVSPVFDQNSMKRMGLNPNEKTMVGVFNDDQAAFLDYHRESVFLQARLRS